MIELMKAVLTEDRFSDPDWVFERKLDGIRCVATKTKDGVTLRSRNDLDLRGRFPAVAEALERDSATGFVLDGEVVAFDGDQTSFAKLQSRDGAPVFFYVFDILRAGGEDVTYKPWRERKQILREAITFDGPIRLTAIATRRARRSSRRPAARGGRG